MRLGIRAIIIGVAAAGACNTCGISRSNINTNNADYKVLARTDGQGGTECGADNGAKNSDGCMTDGPALPSRVEPGVGAVQWRQKTSSNGDKERAGAELDGLRENLGVHAQRCKPT